MTRWRDDEMVLRWAGAYLFTEKNLRKIAACENLCTLAPALGWRNKSVTPQEKFA